LTQTVQFQGTVHLVTDYNTYHPPPPRAPKGQKLRGQKERRRKKKEGKEGREKSRGKEQEKGTRIEMQIFFSLSLLVDMGGFIGEGTIAPS
jgi:hypothetical protein